MRDESERKDPIELKKKQNNNAFNDSIMEYLKWKEIMLKKNIKAMLLEAQIPWEISYQKACVSMLRKQRFRRKLKSSSKLQGKMNVEVANWSSILLQKLRGNISSELKSSKDSGARRWQRYIKTI